MRSGAVSVRRASADRGKVALVIGNSDYEFSPLINPSNDAADMGAALKELGFDVTVLLNADQRSMKRAIDEFGRKLDRDRGTGLFYYAGHGVQVNGRNYLIPVNARIRSENDVEYESVDTGRLLAKMEDAGNDLNIVILDACRNNPFARSFRSANNGLAQLDAPSGSLIAYATAPGSVAADGAGKNGLYTANLLRAMKLPGLSLEQVFKRVRAAVREETDGQQTPWESTSLEGDFYFLPPAGAVAKVPAPAREDSVARPAAAVRPPPDSNRIDRSNLPSVGSGNRGLMFVLDASGSMWGQVQEEPKIAIAKSVLAELLQQTPADTDLGLVAYGHRRKGDCDDVETLLPLTANARTQIIAALDTLNPKGKTPLTASVQQAVEQLRSREDAVTIVVVSDGLESCGGDPCAAVVAARDAGIPFVLHTVGFGLQDAETAELRCMAEAGGGEFYTADTAATLMDGLKTAVKVDFKEGWVNILATSNGALARARIEIFETGNKQRILWKDTSATDAKKNPQKLKLAPGKYTFKITPLDITGAEPKELEAVSIRAGATHVEKMDFPYGTLEVTGLVNGSMGRTRLEVFPAGRTPRVSWRDTSNSDKSSNPVSVILPPGQYDLRVSALDVDGAEPWEKSNVSIQPETTVSHQVDFKQGTLEFGGTINGKLDVVRMRVYKSGSKKLIVWKNTSATDKKRNPTAVRLEPGSYDINVSALKVLGAEPRVIENVQINTAQTHTINEDFARGTLAVMATADGDPIKCRVNIYKADSETHVGWKDTSNRDKKSNLVKFDLAPDLYDVRIRRLDLTGVEPIEIKGVRLGAEIEELLTAEF